MRSQGRDEVLLIGSPDEVVDKIPGAPSARRPFPNLVSKVKRGQKWHFAC
jgi:hypothetical protein